MFICFYQILLPLVILVRTAPVAIYEFRHHFLYIPIPLSPKQQHIIASKQATFIHQTKTTAHFNNSTSTTHLNNPPQQSNNPYLDHIIPLLLHPTFDI
jgi:hypothetical protein